MGIKNSFIEELLLNLPVDLLTSKIYTTVDYINEEYEFVDDINSADIVITNSEQEIDTEGYLIFIADSYNTTFYQKIYDLIESHKEDNLYGFIFKKPETYTDELLNEIRTREENKEYDVLPLECSKETERCNYSNYIQDCCKNHLLQMLEFVNEKFCDFNWWCDKELLMRITDSTRGKITDELEIGVFSKDYNKLIALRSTFLKNGYQFIINQKPREWIRIQVSGKNKIGIDIVPRRNINEVLYWGISGGNKLYTSDSIPSYYVKNIIDKDYEGINVKVPENSKDLLTYRYGSGYGDKAWSFDVKQLIVPNKIEVVDTLPKNVYLYWQGNKNSIIEKCHEIIKSKCSNFEVNILSDEDFESIIAKNKKLSNCNTKIKALYFKVNLLNENGGTWIDSDLVMMKNLEDIINPLNKYDFVGYGKYYGSPDDTFMSCRKGCSLVNLWKRRFDMMLNDNVFSYDKLSCIFNEISDNYKYYNYNNLLFDPFDDLTIYQRNDNGFVDKVKNEGKINCFHLHNKTTKNTIIEDSILAKLLS